MKDDETVEYSEFLTFAVTTVLPAMFLVPTAEDIAADDAAINRAMSGKDGGFFKSLWEGETDSCADEYMADVALADLLRAQVGDDFNRIDRLFRRSGLMRPKWDHRYGSVTYGWRVMTPATTAKK